MKRFILLYLAALFLCFAPGCTSDKVTMPNEEKQLTDYEAGQEPPKKGGTMRLAMAGASSLNPLLAENEHNAQMMNLIYDGLFRRGVNEEIEPVLCSGYSVSEDGLRYEFTIREGVGFHDGDPLSAYDVESTIYMILSSESVYKSQLSAISACSSSGNTLYLTLHHPVINFPSLLDFPVMSDEDISAYDGLTYVPNGTGRYKVQSYKKSKELHLSVNKSYFREFSPYIENITLYLVKNTDAAVAMLENMQIDVLTSYALNLYEYTPKRNLSSVEYTSGRFTFVGINNQKPALLSAKTRQALEAAVDRKELLSSSAVPYVQVTTMPVPETSIWNHEITELEAPDVQRVKTILSEDGWNDVDSNGVPDKDVYGEQVALAPGILVNGENSAKVKLAEQISKAWNAAGIPSYVVAVPYDVYQARIANGEYDVFVGSISLSENYDISFLLKTNANVLGLSNEAIDRLLNVLAISREEHKQAQFHELCNALQEEMPLIGLYFENDVLVFDQAVRGDIKPSGTDVFYNIEQWFLSR